MFRSILPTLRTTRTVAQSLPKRQFTSLPANASSKLLRTGPVRPTTARTTLGVHGVRQQRRTLFENLRARIQHERETGNLKNMRVPAAIAISISVFMIVGITYTLTQYYAWVDSTFHNFPDAVSQPLRKALFFKSRSEHAQAIAHFQKALVAAQEVGMYALSDEVTGMKLALAEYVGDELGRMDKKVEILWGVWDELMRAVEVAGEVDGEEKKRLLKRAVGTGVLLGRTLGGMGQHGREGAVLGRTVETMLREVMPAGGPIREEDKKPDEKVDDGEGGKVVRRDNRFTNEEMGGALEALAAHYTATNKPELATPLYLRTLSLVPPNTCHQVTIMTNLSGSLAHHPLPPTRSRAEFLQDAQTWANKALEIDNNIKPPVRTEECDEACVAALYNLGEIAELLGEKGGARDKYEQARSLADGIGMKEGVERAEEAIKRLEDETS
ncbi:hypothetical protein BJ508DRAFT_230451 [Ascobolus immersus RN42]|uniref:TPR domain-containing protein n=1 Tax=Ascobolus immersus RN42 TaxID=1160509 RepID=A0A3N4HSD1_ASCIM|nr:hypothetical protein BJ508DRAFT_230451 [Ascobolus immersus RN42]